ncbi:MAG: ABC transporter permease [Pseudomonadota bacterium]
MTETTSAEADGGFRSAGVSRDGAVAQGADGPQYAFGARRFGAVNWLGVWTLYKKEVHRYLKVAFQTVFAPVISTILFLVVFMVALGQDRPDVNGAPFVAFLAPGLVMMAILNNAFSNSSSSLIIAKVQGNVVDLLMPPLSAAELTAAFVLGAATRGLMVGAVAAAASAGVMAYAGTPMSVAHLGAIVYFALGASLLFGMLGAIAGVWADKFDQLALVTNFIITPMAFLSGTFYSIERLPGAFQTFSHWNPVFYMIDGFRYGFIGASDADVVLGGSVVLVLNIVFLYVSYRLFKSGYRLKS